MSKPSVAIRYGFGEDSWHGRVLVQALTRQGYRLTDDAAEADIIIAHSAGCFYLPDTGAEQLTVLVGPLYWPGRSLTGSSLVKSARDFYYYRRHGMTRAWLVKTAHNIRCINGDLPSIIPIVQSARRHHDFYQTLRGKYLLIIRNQHDTFLTPEAPQLLKPHAAVMFRTLPGEHDDLWLHPMPYIHLIQSMHEQRRGANAN